MPPRELRAIPSNAILRQLGWCANTLQGLGAATARHPETFAEMQQNGRRFHRALDLATNALAHSDIDVLRAVIATLDPGTRQLFGMVPEIATAITYEVGAFG